MRSGSELWWCCDVVVLQDDAVASPAFCHPIECRRGAMWVDCEIGTRREWVGNKAEGVLVLVSGKGDDDDDNDA